ncbi:Serine carboxypeptidase 1 [Acorus calamus]|uniref:Serine carboxypeptidase 1 n=1 Tax=Acorus calamus TaxID=4465 RepID=A0AAV9F133_ACOCL|nr:Serine carboxypeptidase 1 [Acorus calamus]
MATSPPHTLLSLLFLMMFILLVTEAAPESALVTHLPGFDGDFPSKHYAGYVTVDEDRGRNLYYYFVVSEGNPSKDPVVLWLNGGPGCSSFDGFVYEHGPFNFERVTKYGDMPQLHLNPYSWSKVSSVIYVDSPAGVGLSYSKNKDDYQTGDLKTASDSHTFLLKWFEQYPKFLNNSFYIAGEPYAGVYVPTLASEVAKGIEVGTKPILNLKGYMVGNGVTDTIFDGNALVPFAHGMGLISDDLYKDVDAACQGSYWNATNGRCALLLDKVDYELNDLNIYDILEPCYHSPSIRNIVSSKSRLPDSFRRLGEIDRPFPVRKRMFGRSWPLRAPVKDGRVPTWPELLGSSDVPCTDDEVATTWLNNATVRNAIHSQSLDMIGSWELCTDKIDFMHDAGSMIKYHKDLTSKGYRVLIFSGDHDMCVPYTGSEAWTRSLGYKITDGWRPWILNEQVAGYTQGYEHNLTFLTIKGAGHTVPEYKPKEAFAFFSRWLGGNPI